MTNEKLLIQLIKEAGIGCDRCIDPLYDEVLRRMAEFSLEGKMTAQEFYDSRYDRGEPFNDKQMVSFAHAYAQHLRQCTAPSVSRETSAGQKCDKTHYYCVSENCSWLGHNKPPERNCPKCGAKVWKEGATTLSHKPRPDTWAVKMYCGLPPYDKDKPEAAPLSGEGGERRKKGVYTGAPACFALDLACRQINEAFGDFGCYLVGSALERPDWRDIDVRFIMPDEQFAQTFPDVVSHCWEQDARWLLLTVSISAWLSKLSGLPVDFQVQPQTHANEKHKGQRSALGLKIGKKVTE
jgi:hypothetical protein